jgi:hypothetical protein
MDGTMLGAARTGGKVRGPLTALALVAAAWQAAAGCGSTKEAPPSPPCDQACADGTAMRAVRETMKLAYNLTLQAKPVGTQDATTPCPGGGTAHLFGVATSNAAQGATEVDLTYVLDACAYKQKNTTPGLNYAATLTGTITQKGIIAVQPSSTTALMMESTTIAVAGTVYDPPIAYDQSGCALEMTQNGNLVSGTICGRAAGFAF